MSSLIGAAQGYGTIAVGTAQALQRSLGGHPELVTFLDPVTGNALIQMDAVLSESHGREAAPTVFPLEDGSTISDHIIVTPFELSIQGVITDAPVGDKAGLQTEGLVTALSAIMPPLAVFEAGAAIALKRTIDGSQSRSIAAFHRLLEIQAGNPTARPPTPPRPFNVNTRMRAYKSMVIKSLAVPRDASTGDAIVFQVTMTEMLIVTPQTVNVQVLQNQALAAEKKARGEVGNDDNAFARGNRRGGADTQAVVDRVAGFSKSVVGGIGG